MARVALVQNIMVESVGYMAMSAVLKKQGHTVDVFYCDQSTLGISLKDIEIFRPDIIGFSVLTPSLPFLLSAAQQIKERTGALTIFGNIHILLCPELIQHPSVDMVCLWEGETILAQLCACLDAKTPYHHIHGLWAKKDNQIIQNPLPSDLVDINALPFYDRNMYDKYPFFRHSTYLRLALGRGCPGSCSFCHNAFLRRYYGGGKSVRKMSPERAIEEIDHQVAQRKQVKFIFFTDEVFWLTRDWLHQFLRLYRDRFSIPFSANFHFSHVEESDIQLFASAKVNNLIVAVESGNERIRSQLLNKHVKDEQIFQVTAWMRKYRIAYVSSAMFGLPGVEFDEHVAQIKFYQKLKAHYVWAVFFQPYPGLALTQHPQIREHVDPLTEYAPTAHHHLVIQGPEAYKLENLKKVYFLCIACPFLSPVLIFLCQFRIPILFDIIFMIHFTYYIYRFERISVRQFFVHLKIFGINPLLENIAQKLRTLTSNDSKHKETTGASSKE